MPVVSLLVSSTGISAGTRERKLGAVPAPLAGPASTRLALWLVRAAVRVPVPVTGELVTLNRPGRARPTLVTVPPPPVVLPSWPLASIMTVWPPATATPRMPATKARLCPVPAMAS